MRSLHTISSTYPENSGDILTGSPWSVLTQLCSSGSNGISSAVCRNRRGRWTAIWRGTGATPRLLLFLFVTFTNTKYIWDHIRAKRTQDSQNLFTSLVIKCFRTYGKFPASMLWPATRQATQSETSRTIFPRLPPPSLYSVFWLVHLINCLSCDWPEQSPLLHLTYDNLSLDNRNRLDFCLVKWLARTVIGQFG